MREPTWPPEPDDDEASPRAGTRRLAPVLALAVLPWGVVAALLFLPDRGGPPPPDAAVVDATADRDATTPRTSDQGTGAWPPTPGPQAATTAVPGTQATVPRDGTVPGSVPVAQHASPDLDRRAAALATVVARAWLTGIGPALPIDGTDPPPPTRYADHISVEAIERRGPEAWVVTALAVLLEAEDDDLVATVRRLAVPLAIGPTGPRPAGSPWKLPSPEFAPLLLQPTAAVEDPALLLEAVDALQAAGFEDVALHALHHTAGWPLLAEIETPDDARPRTVWLDGDGDGYVVAGRIPDTVGGPTHEQEHDR